MYEKLGVRGTKTDTRTLKIINVLKILPDIPREFDVDSRYTLTFPTPTYSNTKYGDCVIAGRAHQTLRLEAFEQKKIVPISEKNVVDEYFWESGGADNGLYLLDSLNHWRKDGWLVGETLNQKKRGCWHKPKPVPPPTPDPAQRYNIYAFGEINPKNHDDIKAVCYLLNGVYIGLALPITAQSQDIWSVIGDPEHDKDSKKWSWGGHCVYIKAYDPGGLTCVTWGAYKYMTWEFLDTYCFEAYGIVDNRNAFTPDSPVDVEQLNDYLEQIRRAG